MIGLLNLEMGLYMNRSFCNNKVIYILLVIITLFFICSLSILFRRNIYLYKNYSGTYSNKYIGVFVSKKELEFFYRNSFIFIDGEKYKYEIISIDNDVLKRKGVFYSYILIDINVLFEEGEVIVFSILDRKIVNYKMFNIIWR